MINIELRDYFAAKAMQGLLSNSKMQQEILKQGQSWVVESSYAWADDMLSKRSTSLDAKVPIDAFTFSVRTYNVLNNEGIKSIHDLLKKSETELIRLPNCGRRTVDEIKKILAQHNLKLRNHYE